MDPNPCPMTGKPHSFVDFKHDNGTPTRFCSECGQLENPAEIQIPIPEPEAKEALHLPEGLGSLHTPPTTTAEPSGLHANPGQGVAEANESILPTHEVFTQSDGAKEAPEGKSLFQKVVLRARQNAILGDFIFDSDFTAFEKLVPNCIATGKPHVLDEKGVCKDCMVRLHSLQILTTAREQILNPQASPYFLISNRKLLDEVQHELKGVKKVMRGAEDYFTFNILREKIHELRIVRRYLKQRHGCSENCLGFKDGQPPSIDWSSPEPSESQPSAQGGKT